MNDPKPKTASKKTASKDTASSEAPAEQSSPGQASDNLLAVLAYVPVLCLLTLLQADQEPGLRAHARQGLVLFLLEIILALLLIPGVSAFLLTLALVICLLFALFAAWNAWNGDYWRIPYVADIAEREREKGS